MECEVAREALSARIDGEREPVPAARVDEHVQYCDDCLAWLRQARTQAALLRELAAPPVAAVSPAGTGKVGALGRRTDWTRAALLIVGLAQIVIAGAQGMGFSLGLASHHGMEMTGHLLNESTAWTLALGVVMAGAAVWPTAAAGLAGVLCVYCVFLTAYVTRDAMAGAVTAERIVTHLPLVLGALLALLVWRRSSKPGPQQHSSRNDSDIQLPHNASRGKRRGHLWPTDGSAA